MSAVPDWWKPYAAKWPGWKIWRGIDNLFYASLDGSNPAIITRGESAEDLSDMIVRADSDHKSWGQKR